MPHSWEAAYPPGISCAKPLPPPQPLHGFLEATARNFPTRIALHHAGIDLTYAELLAKARRAAAGLAQLGVARGTMVAIELPNSLEFVVAFFAVTMAGGTVVNIGPHLPRRRLMAQLADSGARLLIARPADFGELFAAGLLDRILVCAPDVVTDDRTMPFATLLETPAAPLPAIDPRTDIAVLQYTGGSTGAPKAAMLSHANLGAVLEAGLRWYGPGGEDERQLVLMPFSHISGLASVLLLSLARGVTLSLPGRGDAAAILAAIAAERITQLYGVPSLYAALADHSGLAKAELSSLRRCTAGGAPLPPDVRDRFLARTGIELSPTYGLTEASPLVTLQPPRRKAGSVGVPAPGTLVDIRDPETGACLPPGKTGEICVQGQQVMRGYWHRPEDSAQALRGGMLHTGDIGYLDEDGYLFVLDRQRDMLISAGFKLFPSQIEAALHTHPAIAEAAVIGIADRYLGQAAKAFLTLREGHAAPQPADLRRFLSASLASYELPQQFVFLSELPRTHAGKIAKEELRGL